MKKSDRGPSNKQAQIHLCCFAPLRGPEYAQWAREHLQMLGAHQCWFGHELDRIPQDDCNDPNFMSLYWFIPLSSVSVYEPDTYFDWVSSKLIIFIFDSRLNWRISQVMNCLILLCFFYFSGIISDQLILELISYYDINITLYFIRSSPYLRLILSGLFLFRGLIWSIGIVVIMHKFIYIFNVLSPFYFFLLPSMFIPSFFWLLSLILLQQGILATKLHPSLKPIPFQASKKSKTNPNMFL